MFPSPVAHPESHAQASGAIPERIAMLEAVSDRLLRHAEVALWRALFAEGTQHQVRFARRWHTFVAVQPGSVDWCMEHEVVEQLRRAVLTCGGELCDRPPAGALAAFPDPVAALSMAARAQRAVPEARLQIGVHSGLGHAALVPAAEGPLQLYVGDAVDAAVALMRQAAARTIQVSPAAYRSLAGRKQPAEGWLVSTEFVGDEVTGVSLTMAPEVGAPSTFVGLGRPC